MIRCTATLYLGHKENRWRTLSTGRIALSVPRASPQAPLVPRWRSGDRSVAPVRGAAPGAGGSTLTSGVGDRPRSGARCAATEGDEDPPPRVTSRRGWRPQQNAREPPRVCAPGRLRLDQERSYRVTPTEAQTPPVSPRRLSPVRGATGSVPEHLVQALETGKGSRPHRRFLARGQGDSPPPQPRLTPR